MKKLKILNDISFVFIAISVLSFAVSIAYSHLNTSYKTPFIIADVFVGITLFLFFSSSTLFFVTTKKINKIKMIEKYHENYKSLNVVSNSKQIIDYESFNKQKKYGFGSEQREIKSFEEMEKEKKQNDEIWEKAKKRLEEEALAKARTKKSLITRNINKSLKLLKKKSFNDYLLVTIKNVEEGTFDPKFNEYFHDNFFKDLDYEIYFNVIIGLIDKKYGNSRKISNDFLEKKSKWINNVSTITKRQIENMKNYGFPPEKFLEILSRGETLTGCYKIYNASRNMYYIGQAQNIYKRVYNHFHGKGNGDIYADYKYGGDFYVNYYLLKDSTFKSLDAYEKYLIDKFHSLYPYGYNKKDGNKYY